MAPTRRAWAVALLWLSACGGQKASQHEAERKQVQGTVVATVNGRAIGLDHVRELVAETGLAPREALQRLVEAELLEQHAEQLGYRQSSAGSLEHRRALVRTLLAETIEREVHPDAIPFDQVRQRFEEAAKRAHLSANELGKYESDIRKQLAVEQRQVALERLIARLRLNDGVVLDEAEVAKLLSDPSLWGGSS